MAVEMSAAVVSLVAVAALSEAAVPVEFDHEAAAPPEPAKALDPEVFPRAAYRLADLLDELVEARALRFATFGDAEHRATPREPSLRSPRLAAKPQ